MLKNFPIVSEERINDYITKVMPFNEGYNFLKGSNTQYNLRSQLARELKPWASYYNIRAGWRCSGWGAWAAWRRRPWPGQAWARWT